MLPALQHKAPKDWESNTKAGKLTNKTTKIGEQIDAPYFHLLRS